MKNKNKNTMPDDMRDWLIANMKEYEKYLLHAMIHSPTLRPRLMCVLPHHRAFDSNECQLIVGAFACASMMESVLGIEIPYPTTFEFLKPHILAASFELECNDLEIELAISLVNDLQNPKYGEMHDMILPYFDLWFGTKRAKCSARQIMMNPVLDAREIVEALQADLDAASGLSFDLEDRRFDYCQQPVPPKSIIALAGHSIGTPGNLVTIQGPVKSAKSTVLEGIIAAALKSTVATCDTFGICVADMGGLALLHFDTEQSKYDHDRLLRRSYRRAKRHDAAAWLHSFHLTGMDPAASWNMLALAVKSAVKNHGAVVMILIDGIADFCKDPNDAEECFELVRKLHKLAVDRECVIVCVIHENPGNGGGKTRGHLGSQLDRKAETSLRLQKDTKTAVVEMWVERGRSCFIPKSAGIRFHWSSDAQLHVTLHASDSDVAGTSTRKPDKLSRYAGEVEKVLVDGEVLSWTTLVGKIETVTLLARPTAITRIPEYVALNLITKNEDGTYQIARPKSAE
jgi:hypothetical protein